nr:glycosyltransferase [Lachnospiraceae bacterium]
MNIVINAIIAYENPRGVGRYFNNLLPEIIKNDKGNNQYFVYYGKWMESYDFLKTDSPNVHFIEAKVKNNPVIRNLYQAFTLPRDCKKYDPDVLFLINTLALWAKPCKVLSTIHDIMEFDFPEKYPFIQRYFRRAVVRHQVKISDRVITDSLYSRNAICRRFGVPEDNIHVVPCSVKVEQRKEVCEPDKYFLFVSESEKAKNLM